MKLEEIRPKFEAGQYYFDRTTCELVKVVQFDSADNCLTFNGSIKNYNCVKTTYDILQGNSNYEDLKLFWYVSSFNKKRITFYVKDKFGVHSMVRSYNCKPYDVFITGHNDVIVIHPDYKEGDNEVLYLSENMRNSEYLTLYKSFKG
jgi:hypothetical protein